MEAEKKIDSIVAKRCGEDAPLMQKELTKKVVEGLPMPKDNDELIDVIQQYEERVSNVETDIFSADRMLKLFSNMSDFDKKRFVSKITNKYRDEFVRVEEVVPHGYVCGAEEAYETFGSYEMLGAIPHNDLIEFIMDYNPYLLLESIAEDKHYTQHILEEINRDSDERELLRQRIVASMGADELVRIFANNAQLWADVKTKL